MEPTLPPHLDDEALSSLIDGEPDPGAPHLGTCVECQARQAALADARAAIASVAPAAIDELTRRRLLTRALADVPTTAAAAPRWYRRPGTLGVAAAIAAVVLAVPLLASLDSGGDDDSSAAPAARLAESTAADSGYLFAGSDLGDLGEISEDTLRERLAITRAGALDEEAGTSAAPAAEAAPAAPAVPAGSPTPNATATPAAGASPAAPESAAPAPKASSANPTASGRATGAGESPVEDLRRDAGDAATKQRAFGPITCVEALRADLSPGNSLRATGTGTRQGTPVVVAVFDAPDGTTTAYLLDPSDECRRLQSYVL